MNKIKKDKDEIISNKVSESSSKKSVVKQILPYLKKEWKLLVMALFAMLIFSSSKAAIPLIIKFAIDQFVNVPQQNSLILIGLGFITLAIAHAGSFYLMEFSLLSSAQKILYQLRQDLFDHIQKLPVNFFSKNSVGRLMSRVLGDTDELQTLSDISIHMIGDIMMLIWIIISMLSLNVSLGSILLLTIPVITIYMILWKRKATLKFLQARSTISAVNADLNVNISSVRDIQAMNRQNLNIRAFDQLNQDNKKASLTAILMAASIGPVVTGLTGIALVMAILLGGHLVVTGQMTIGTLIASVLYIQLLFDPIGKIISHIAQFQKSMASGERIFQILNYKKDIIYKEAKEMPKIKGDVSIEDISFSYDNKTHVLNHVNLSIQAGETLALVGPTGSGKSTLAQIIAHTQEEGVTSGCIKLDGNKISEFNQRSITKQIAVIPQSPFLFSGSVMDNIKFNTNITDEYVYKITQYLGIHVIIQNLQHGYDTIMSENGNNLSIGQRQLISFARALVRDPSLIIMDEATAHIDSKTEIMIQEALNKLLSNRTSVIIAHRLSTIRDANQIAVLDHGNIIELGNHKNLIEINGKYAEMYQSNDSLAA